MSYKIIVHETSGYYTKSELIPCTYPTGELFIKSLAIFFLNVVMIEADNC